MPVTTTVGSREAVARWPVPEERRTLSVLFVDIVGSTGLVERLDPEDVRALQRGYFSTVAGVLRRWNGVVEKYIGDAVMALFGAQHSDGFDAYRAVRAGLEIQEALDRRAPAGPRLRVRVGVATGEALVELAATRDGGHGAASGAVITTAARLQAYAPAGGVVVCAATRQAVAGLLELRPLAAMSVAGKAQPLDVWRVTGLGRPGPAGHQGPFVGRRRELATAGGEIARAVRERRPRWVSLAGPAGSGRSRLLHELARAVSTVDGVAVRWCVAQCPPYPRGELAPLAQMVRAFAGVHDTDPAGTVRRRLATALDGLLPPARRGAAAHALADFVAAPEDAGAAARGAEVWREVLLDLAAGRPLVVAVDDLDRAAPPLNRFLHRLFAAATERQLPLAVVATHGPGWADLLAGAAGRRRRVPLAPLSTVDTGRLLRHLLDRAGRPAALARELLPLTAGNPAVARAYVRAVNAGGDPAGPVPDVVRQMVDARLDRLDGPQRAVLMAGAAHGTDFTADTVERLLGWAAGRAEPVLRGLVEVGVLRRTGRDRYAVTEPTVARVARHRLPRTLRAEFTRRARPSMATRAARQQPGTHPSGMDGSTRPRPLAGQTHPAATGIPRAGATGHPTVAGTRPTADPTTSAHLAAGTHPATSTHPAAGAHPAVVGTTAAAVGPDPAGVTATPGPAGTVLPLPLGAAVDGGRTRRHRGPAPVPRRRAGDHGEVSLVLLAPHGRGPAPVPVGGPPDRPSCPVRGRPDRPPLVEAHRRPLAPRAPDPAPPGSVRPGHPVEIPGPRRTGPAGQDMTGSALPAGARRPDVPQPGPSPTPSDATCGNPARPRHGSARPAAERVQQGGPAGPIAGAPAGPAARRERRAGPALARLPRGGRSARTSETGPPALAAA
ncbi:MULTISPECIES: adenylate/guanylate cyclase domain-containing protein [Micromonospora]|uniref:adenylate/guanylate cyclase domain-containing protein n=1 Tax=Micromonospora TaxID=1873 RepID=UPI0018F5C81A|nr:MULTISPECIES: adenylate/guanylate cyclase domain-containing protein [Micromonospora]